MLNKFETEGYCDYSSEWAVYQHMLVQVKNGAFRDAQFEYKSSEHYVDAHTHGLSMFDSFR